MFAHALKLRPALVLLLLVVGGCKSSPPPLPGNVDPREYNKPVSDNWLFDRMRGREAPPAAPTGVSAAKPGSQVVQASATEPAAETAGAVTVVPPAGSKDDPATKKEEEESSFLDFAWLAPENITKSVKKAFGYGPDEKIARAAFDEGEALYREKKYKEAAAKFSTVISRWPDTPLEEDALFMLAECYFFTDDYNDAFDTYSKLLKKYEASRYLDRSIPRMFATGRYWEDLADKEKHWPLTPNFTDKKQPMFDTLGWAVKAYEQVRLDDPTGPLADDAVMATGNLNFKHGHFAEAAESYDLLRKEYAKSKHLLDADVLDVKAKLEVYQGSVYDGTPLKEAGQIAQETLTQFPDKLGAEKQRMIETKNNIVQQQAERSWKVAQYYDSKDYFGAARIYYRDVIQNYPQTQFAVQAQARLEQIKDLPAEPKNYLKPLDNLLSTRPKLPPLQETAPATKTVDFTP